jgi:AcrR family transcriptional regulator
MLGHLTKPMTPREDVLLQARFEPRGTAAKILDAAEQVFSEHGYAGTSTREVARRAAVPFGALHYHWGSKKQLWDAVFRRLADRTRDTIIGNFAPGATLGALLDNLVDAFLDFFAEHRTVARLCHRASLESPELHREVHSMFTELEALGRGLLRELVPELQIDAQAAIFVLTNAFIASIVDESSQEAFLGGSIFASQKPRERLRKELRRLSRAVFQVEEEP